MKNYTDVPNVHAIIVRFIGGTNHKSSCVKLTSQRFERDSITLNYDHSKSGTMDIAVDGLVTMGYTVIGRAEMPNAYLVFVDEFKALKEAKVEGAKEFHFSFKGRQAGAIGKTYLIRDSYYAVNLAQALYKLWSDYEHITGLKNRNKKVSDRIKPQAPKQAYKRTTPKK